MRVTRRTVRHMERVGIEQVDGTRVALKLRGWGQYKVQGYRLRDGQYVEIPSALVASAVSFDR